MSVMIQINDERVARFLTSNPIGREGPFISVLSDGPPRWARAWPMVLASHVIRENEQD